MKKTLVLLLVLLLSCAFVFAGGAKEGGAGTEGKHVDLLTVGITSWPTAFDPGVSMGAQTSPWLYEAFDTILYIQDDGSLSSYVCSSWKKVADDTFEFTLKPGITFHNGEALGSDDVKFTLDRLIHDDAGYCNGNIKQLVSTIKEVQIIDDLSFRVITNGPDPILFERLASPLGAYIVPKDAIEANGQDYLKANPIGTGPYKFVEIGPETLELEYYEGYYGERPLANHITYRRYTEDAALMVGLVTGEVDITPSLDMESAQAIQSRTQDVIIYNEPYSTTHLLRLNAQKGATADKKLRQALSLAIDRQLLCDTLWDGYAYVPNGYNFEEFGDYYIPDYPQYEYNPEKAKQLVAESTYNGETISFKLVRGYYKMGNEAAEAICAMWKEIGVNAEVVYVESINPKKTDNVSNWSNGLRFSDPLGGLWTLWGEGTNPQTYLFPPEVIDRFNELGHLMETETDVAKRREYYREMMTIWDDEVIGIILYCPNVIWAVNAKYSLSRVPGRGFNLRADHLTLN